MQQTKPYTVLGVLFTVLLLAGVLFVYSMRRPVAAPVVQTPVNTVEYACMGSKALTASYFTGTTTPAVSADQPPIPGGSVQLVLSDGRAFTLPQTISASGVRYASANDAQVFWNKDRGAFLTEGDTETYSGCIEIAPDPGNLPQTYATSSLGFSLRLPQGYTTDTSYIHQVIAQDGIAGVKFTIPSTMAEGTNLSKDTYVSVETLPQATTCSADLFFFNEAKALTVTEGGTTYSVATLDDAAAGNRYEETVFALPGTSPCLAVRYFVHYGVFENYPAGRVTQFNQATLTAQFDAIRRSIVVAQ